MKSLIVFILLFGSPILAVNASGVYQTPEAFLQEVFKGAPPAPQTVWLTGEIRKAAEKILQHKPSSLRVRYWLQGKRSGWVLEEIGKEKPITVGVAVNDNRLEHIRVLVFRESRGYEVRHAFFTEQFKQTRLKQDLQLDRLIDGITGATLSVRALTKLSRLALYLHKQVVTQHDAP